MYGGISLLNNESLFDRFSKAQEPQRMELLFEMARRVGTSKAMRSDMYRENLKFRNSIDETTVRLFRQYKLNGGQNDNY
jgi:hypothetical protein